MARYTYEYYSGGRLVERVQPVPGEYEDTRLGTARLARIESGDRDGWYHAGEWSEAEAQRAAVADRTAAEVLADVGEDPARALVALQIELKRPKPRRSLVGRLQALAGPLLDDEPDTEPAADAATDTTEE